MSSLKYRLWQHLNNRMIRIAEYGKVRRLDPIRYKIWKRLSKKLLKNGMIQNYSELMESVRLPLNIYKNPVSFIYGMKKEEGVLNAATTDNGASKAASGSLRATVNSLSTKINTLSKQFEARSHCREIIAGSGFYYSGSSTLVGLFSECDNFTVSGYADYTYSEKKPENTLSNSECTFIRASKILPLIEAFYSRNKLKQDLAIKNFIERIYFCYDKKGCPGEYKPEIYNDAFLQLSLSLLLSLIKLDDETREYMKNKRFPFVFNSSTDTSFENCSFMRGTGVGQYLFYELREMSDDAFKSYISNYIQDYFYLFNSREFLFCDALLPPQPVNILGHVNNFSGVPIKRICIWRDPRDQFVSTFRNDILFMPRDIDGFVEFYTRDLVPLLNLSDPDCMMVRFEDLVLKYDETTRKIFDFIGTDKSHHTSPKTVFNPARSVVNIGAYKSFIDQDLMKQIEERLGEYCYHPEKENLSEEAWNLLKANNFG